ncbi:hypothetical protein GCM10018790_69080 [Kitasatospora xanthocidica]|uniref:hypothetical protein n=1 Tax=Kitasatospora xanthocidica TaxID=83382 RepID=UPI0016721086|nr:hypothetical protein [Kitasatospora xanthocidica]GHF81516.1 hypothetical protein GCM10018790_69080 [Kitasatospora xanthocidica]
MKLFRSKSAPQYDPDLTALTTDQAEHLRELVRRYHAGIGVRVTVSGRTVQRAEGSSNLYNLAEFCRRADRGEWPALVERHYAALAGAADSTPGQDAEVLRCAYLRLIADDAIPAELAPEFGYLRPVATGLQEALCLDLPDTVRTLDDRFVAEVGLERLRAAGRANLIADPVEYDVLQGPTEGSTLYAVHGESMFVASKALVLDELARAVTGRELPQDGALFTAPSRDYLFFHPLVEPQVAGAVNDLADIALRVHSENPGPLSPRLYWWHRGTVTNLTHIDEAERSFSIQPPAELMAILRRLSG